MDRPHLDAQTALLLKHRGLSYQEEEEILDHLAECQSCRNLVEVSCSPDRRPSEERTEDGRSVELEASVPIIPEGAYSSVVDRAIQSLVGEEEGLENQRATAGELLAELDGFAATQQTLMVKNSARYQVWALAEALLDESQRGWSEDPERSERLAVLALEVAARLSAHGHRRLLIEDLKAEAWSYIGNCRRIQSDLYAAQEAFRSAWLCLASGSGDSMARARVLDLESSLQRANRNFTVAREMILEAVAGYRSAGDRHMEARALIKMSYLLTTSGDLTESVSVMERAAELLEPNSDPGLVFGLNRNLMLALTELGRTEEARSLVPKIRELAISHGGRLERLRVLWAEGLLCKRLGQVELAEESLTQVRKGFIEAGIGYDVALVSVDLAALYLEWDRTAEVRQLSTETYPLFAVRGVRREALAAWNLFRQAAEREAVTLRLLDDVASRIRQVKGSPSEPEGGS